MGYEPRLPHAFRALILAGALAAGGAVAAAVPAGAAASLGVTLSACGTGSAATWNAAGDLVLTPGTATAGTCGAPAGSTYDPAYAQAVINGVAGTAVPTPSDTTGFTTDNYAAGSPRLVIELASGHSLWGYPAASGLNGTAMAWAVDNGSTYTDYATAYNTAGAAATTVRDAFLVADADQAAGTHDTITGLAFGGSTLPAGADVVTVTAPAAQSSTEGTAVTPVQVQASSSKGDGIASWSAAGLPAGLSVSGSGVISGTPSSSATPGDYPVTVTATDNGGTSGTSASFTWTVRSRSVTPPPSVIGPGQVSSFTDYSASCLDNRNFTWKPWNPLQLWKCGAAGSADQTLKAVPQAGGGYELEFVTPAGVTGSFCVTESAPGTANRLVLGNCAAGAGRQVVRILGGAGACKCGVYYEFGDGLVMNDKAWDVSNGAAVIAYGFTGARNEAWSQP